VCGVKVDACVLVPAGAVPAFTVVDGRCAVSGAGDAGAARRVAARAGRSGVRGAGGVARDVTDDAGEPNHDARGAGTTIAELRCAGVVVKDARAGRRLRDAVSNRARSGARLARGGRATAASYRGGEERGAGTLRG
jgi:hypothetical protein